MSNRKYVKTRKGNKNNKKNVTGRKGDVTSKLSTGERRKFIGIPEKAKIYDFLYGNNTIIKVPKWELLDMIYGQAEHNKEVEAIRIYDIFVKSISVYYPDKENDLNKLRPLIIKHILRGHILDESYYKEIREL